MSHPTPTLRSIDNLLFPGKLHLFLVYDENSDRNAICTEFGLDTAGVQAILNNCKTLETPTVSSM